ncbi:MAG: STAS domain-containing protein [Sedimentisphaerales bacterium]|nr:STAS domain-containing protein [Sedimentisphaerales bacterium]
MKISLQNYHDVTVIELQGEVDGEMSDMLKDTIVETISHGRARIVLDMSNVGGIDSEGLDSLLWIRDYTREHHAQLRLAGLDENCEKILEITRLQFEFDLHAELTEAVKSFA